MVGVTLGGPAGAGGTCDVVVLRPLAGGGVLGGCCCLATAPFAEDAFALFEAEVFDVVALTVLLGVFF